MSIHDRFGEGHARNQDPESWKPNSRYDLAIDEDGNIYVIRKGTAGGSGAPELTGYNLYKLLQR